MNYPYNVVFNGTPEATVEWLIANADNWEVQQKAQVCVGKTLETMSIDDYLREHDRSSQK